MNILQLVPKLNIGGVEKGTIEVARYLALNGHKAVVVSAGGILEKSLAACGARHYKLPVGSKNPLVMIYAFFALRHIIRKENIDIVHARSRIPALVGYFASRSTDRIFITTAHGQYKKHLISRVMAWGKVVIVANQTMARYMKENFGVPVRKLSIIPRGVDLKKFSYIPPSQRSSRVFKVGIISRFTPLKGHLDFLKSASYLARKIVNLKIILMGDRTLAKEEYMKKIDLAVKRLMLTDIIEFKGSDQDVATVMEELNVLVSANREQEAFGRSVIEAQARGVNVVATKVGGVVENVIDGQTGFVCEPANPQDMADKILQYEKNRDLAEKIAQKARKVVEEKYSLTSSMEKTLEAYSHILFQKNILIFKISSLGDVILAIPSIRAVREKFKQAVIKVMVDVKYREVLDNCPYIDEIITSDLKGRDGNLRILRLAGKIREEGFDISIDLQNNRKSHLLAFLGAIKERYGYDNGKFSVLLNRKITPSKVPMLPVKHQGCVLGLLGITKIDNRLELWPRKDSDEWAKKFLESNWLKKDQKLVAINIAASKKWKTKNWGINNLAEVSDLLASGGIRVVLVGACEDEPEVKKFLKKTQAKPIDAVGRTSISQLISLVKFCDCLLTPDTATMHVASAVGTPFVALFGPTDPKRHLPPAQRYKLLYRNLKCSPCYKPNCLRKTKCMTSITPQEVYDAAMELLEESTVNLNNE